MKSNYTHLYIILSFILVSCSKNSSNATDPIIEPNTTLSEDKELSAFNLVFPEDQSLCTEGLEKDNQIELEFSWEASENATSYSLELSNITNDTKTTFSSETTTKTIMLDKGTQYGWKVIAKRNDDEMASAAWSFYSQGSTVENYAPFPAEISITDKGNQLIDISWSGADLDNDIISYSVYMNEIMLLENTTDTVFDNAEIVYDNSFEITVVTKDAAGNTSANTKSFWLSS